MEQAVREQQRFLTGAGAYTDDRAPRDALHAAFVRATLGFDLCVSFPWRRFP